jgi:molybdenum cofactor biosynthesis protein B
MTPVQGNLLFEGMMLIRLRKKRGKIKVKSGGSNKIFLDPETKVNIYKIYLEKSLLIRIMGVNEHKKQAPRSVTLGIISVSTTRALIDDTSGQWIREHAEEKGHTVVFHQVIPDDAAKITAILKEKIKESKPQVILMSGGTGITKKDVTIEAVSPLFNKELSAFGPLFAKLSMEEIDSAAIMSRATAGVIGNTVVLCMPGSLNACRLACSKLIFPELGHLVKHIQDF